MCPDLLKHYSLSCGGVNGIVPTAEQAEEPLKMMVKTVQSGGSLSKYLAFDKQGELLHFS